MKLNRRGFLSLSALLGVSYAENSAAAESSYRRNKGFPILQTYTDARMATFSAVLTKGRSFSIEVTDHNGRSAGRVKVEYENRDHSEWMLAKIVVRSLSLGVTYNLQIVDRDRRGEVRQFRTLDLGNKNANVAILSCMSDKTHRPKMWARLKQEKPDALFFVGDAVYADMTPRFEWRTADPRQLWNRFVQAWQTIDLYSWKMLVPVFSTWDDHDFGDNNSDRSYRHKAAALENFKLFYGPDLETASLQKGPGLSFCLMAFGQQFLFLDGRTFRSEKRARWQTMFGENQEKWIFSQLRRTRKPVWLINGSQWFGGYLEKESYEHMLKKSFWKFIEDLKATGRFVSFISGDVHFSEVMKIEEGILEQETLEITSSCMHSMTVPGWHQLFKNPRRIASTGHHNFVTVQFERNGKIQSEKITCFGNRQKPYFSVRRSLRF